MITAGKIGGGGANHSLPCWFALGLQSRITSMASTGVLNPTEGFVAGLTKDKHALTTLIESDLEKSESKSLGANLTLGRQWAHNGIDGGRDIFES